jgi:hypothetical protein
VLRIYNTLDRQTIFLIILLLALAGGGWVWYQSRVTPGDAAQSAGPSQDILDIEARMAEIRRLKTVEINTSVFQDSRFRALKEITATSSPAVSPGRLNPFAPL